MIIGVAGPYSAPDAEQRARNLQKMTDAAVGLRKMGHTPLIGVHAALPLVEDLEGSERYEAIMKISLAVISACDALLLIGESKGANMERDLVLAAGKPVFRSLDEVEKYAAGKS